MTDPNTTAPDTAPATVTIPAGSQSMEFATADPMTGKAYTAKEQFQQRLQNKKWVADADCGRHSRGCGAGATESCDGSGRSRPDGRGV